MDTFLDQLVNQVEVVVQGVLGLLGVGDVTRVTDSTFNNTTCLLGGVDTELHVFDIVQRIEHSENVQTVLDGLLGEVVNGVVGVRSVTNSVGTSNQGLQRDVWNQLSQSSQTVPRVFVQESHSDIEGGTTPTLQGISVGESVTGLLGNVGHVDRSHSGSQEGLVGISPGRVHNQTTRVRTNSLGECFGAFVDDNVPPTFLTRLAGVQFLGRVLSILQRGNSGFVLETGLTVLTLDGTAVDSEVTKVGQKLGSSVLTGDQLEEIGSIIDEGSPCLSAFEYRVGEKSDQEGDVGLSDQRVR